MSSENVCFSCNVSKWFLILAMENDKDETTTQLSVRIDPKIKKSLKFVAVEQDKTLTSLFMEAIKDLLRKYGKKAKE